MAFHNHMTYNYGMDIAATPILAQQLMLNQQNIGLAVMKAGAQADQAIANILEQAVQAAKPADGSRGNLIDISA